MKRKIIVGDIHGCLPELLDLLKKVNYSSEDKLILLGDLINKGPDSLGVLKFAKDNQAIALMGNHEQAFLRYIENDEEGYTLAEVKEALRNDLSSWVNYIQSFPFYYEDDEVLVVHAGVRPNMDLKSLSKRDKEIITNIRTWDGQGENLRNSEDPAWFELYEGKKLIVFGHWAAKGLVERENVIGLDTGCVYGNKLSALILPEREIVHVDAQKAYVEIKK